MNRNKIIKERYSSPREFMLLYRVVGCWDKNMSRKMTAMLFRSEGIIKLFPQKKERRKAIKIIIAHRAEEALIKLNKIL